MQGISAIVVTYNSGAEVGACLDALQGCGEVIVVDNASADESVAVASERPGVTVLANASNLGFAGAVNQGARRSAGRYLLILNPDAVIESGLDRLREACERHGIAAGLLLNPDGSLQSGFTVRRLPTAATLVFECLGLNRMWPGNPVNRRYRYPDLDLSKPALVEQPAGAFLMIRRDVFDRLGGFDERFWPVWYEDVDFCKRAAAAGYAIGYTPDARARHSGGHSVQSIETRSKRLYWYGSLLKYADKHYRPLTFRTVCCAIVLGCLVRMPARIMGRWGGRQGEYSRVLQLAVASFLAGRVVSLPTADSGDENASPARPIAPVVDENR